MPGQKMSPISNPICDLLMDIQMRCKFVEELITSYNSGLRDQEDFNGRFVSQGTILGEKCRKIAPMINDLLMKGEGLYQNKENPNIISAYKNIELQKQKDLEGLTNEYRFGLSEKQRDVNSFREVYRDGKNENPISPHTPLHFFTIKSEGLASK
jgi:hypothetical protein